MLPAPAVAIVASGPTTFCSGDSLTLLATSGLGTYKWSTGDTNSSIVVTNSGNYTVTVTNAAGCSATNAAQVTVNPSPNPIVAGPASACPNSTTAYSVTNVASDTYLWTLVPTGAGTITSPSTASTSIQTTDRYLGSEQDIEIAVNDNLGL